MMLAHVYLKKGAIVPRHSHENEQITYILEGGLRFWIGADESQVIDVLEGEVLSYSIPCSAQSGSPGRYPRRRYLSVRRDRDGWIRQMIKSGEICVIGGLTHFAAD